MGDKFPPSQVTQRSSVSLMRWGAMNSIAERVRVQFTMNYMKECLKTNKEELDYAYWESLRQPKWWGWVGSLNVQSWGDQIWGVPGV